MNVFAQSIGTWPSFVLAGTAALIALFLARRWLPPVDRPVDAPRLSVVSNVLWAYALLAGTASLIAVGGGFNLTARLVILATGVVALVAFWLVRRRLARRVETAVHIRAVTVALFAGVIIAFAQTAPLAQAPIFFQLAQGFSPIWAVAAIVPIILALVFAGPIAGWLLMRLEPRVLIAGGLAVLGLGDLAVALAAPDTGYLYFVIPFLAIGAGFVIGTTIRTAIIFASVPRHLPATADALNQTSITVGTELGLVVVTSVVATVAIDAFGRSVATALAPVHQAAAIAKFTDCSTPSAPAHSGPSSATPARRAWRLPALPTPPASRVRHRTVVEPAREICRRRSLDGRRLMPRRAHVELRREVVDLRHVGVRQALVSEGADVLRNEDLVERPARFMRHAGQQPFVGGDFRAALLERREPQNEMQERLIEHATRAENVDVGVQPPGEAP